jgi:hypothetical protein
MNASADARRRPYNERLFEGRSIRSFLHNARFEWFRNRVQKHVSSPFSMVELGCFDGRLIEFCPQPPLRYAGLDADWEGGLTAALKRFDGHPQWHFYKARDASAMRDLPSASFAVGASLETLEHVPPELVDDYLRELARVIDGWLFVSVPNEKGPAFLAKYLAKRFVMRSAQPYTPSEIWHATCGRMAMVERVEHKGFDWQSLIRQIEKYFEVVAVESIPFKSLPKSAAFTIGVIARSRQSI